MMPPPAPTHRPFLVHSGTPALVGLLALGVYCWTRSPGVAFIDSGELSTVAALLGVAHPTGYPLFTLLGRVFTMLPIAAEPIARLNIMAAVLTSLAVVCVYLIQLSLFRHIGARSPVDEPSRVLAAAGGACLVGFSQTVWATGLAVEVYSLHLLLVSVVLLLVVEAGLGRKNPVDERLWRGAALATGLAFANHMTTILLLPACVTLYAMVNGFGLPAWKRGGRLLPWFVLGLTPYLYLPLRASQEPLLNWGNVTTLERLLWHVSGKQYRVWIFSSVEAAGRQLNYFLGRVPEEFAVVGLLFAIGGLVVLWRWNRKAFAFTLMLFLTCVLYSINYDIHDIDSYFLIAYLVLGLWAGVGLYGLGIWLRARLIRRRAILAPVLLLPAVVVLGVNWPRVDQSTDFAVEDYTMAMFSSFAPNAMVLSFQWDYWVSPSYYYQFVRGHRPDVAVIDKELLRRSWYIAELRRRCGWLLDRNSQEVGAFLTELKKFEHDLPYNPGVIQSKFVAMIRAFIARAAVDRPVYVTGEIEPEFTAGYQRVPEGLAFRLHADTAFHPTSFPAFRYRPVEGKNRYQQSVRRLYAEALLARARYYAGRGDAAEARRSLEEASRHDSSAIAPGAAQAR